MKTLIVLTLILFAVISSHVTLQIIPLYFGNDPIQPFIKDPVLKDGLNEKQKKELLDIHNSLRAQVANGQVPGQPSAANMNKLKWSEESAAMAKKWADRCEFLPDASTNRNYGQFTSVGQNIYVSKHISVRGGDGTELNSIVNSWFSENQDFSYSNRNCRDDKKCIYYTQLAWAQATELGCGLADCQRNWFKMILVCNYAPSGDYVLQPIYAAGTACSQCPSELSECDEGLCSPKTTG